MVSLVCVFSWVLLTDHTLRLTLGNQFQSENQVFEADLVERYNKRYVISLVCLPVAVLMCAVDIQVNV